MVLQLRVQCTQYFNRLSSHKNPKKGQGNSGPKSKKKKHPFLNRVILGVYRGLPGFTGVTCGLPVIFGSFSSIPKLGPNDDQSIQQIHWNSMR